MLTDPETQKLQAALEQLESERQRRIDERIVKGEVVRVLPVVVGSLTGSRPLRLPRSASCKRPAKRARFTSASPCSTRTEGRLIASP